MPKNTTTKKFSPTTQQYSNIKIINKNFRFSKYYILETCNQHLIELIFKPVQGFSSGDLGIVKYLFITITPRSTLTWSDSTC